uniref:Uncharacterized protein n=1 Tax=Leersia perrieri TaxID=77586 RepID=A0A0D9WQW6_9ORYZ
MVFSNPISRAILVRPTTISRSDSEDHCQVSLPLACLERSEAKLDISSPQVDSQGYGVPPESLGDIV